MQGIKRKIVFVTLYELIAIACITIGLTVMFGQSATHSGVAAVASSVIAVTWNFIYNVLFEAWEARQAKRGRSLLRRIAHAVGFEGGLVLVGVPLLAWWLGISLVQALMLDIGFVAFFLVYSFAYNWMFDILFGLPISAQATAIAPGPASNTPCPGAGSTR
jgi:uncharacterized membrane protein